LTLALLLGLLFVPRYPSALIALAAAIVLAQVLKVPGTEFATVAATALSIPSLPSLAEFERAFTLFVLPQLSLTLTRLARPLVIDNRAGVTWAARSPK